MTNASETLATVARLKRRSRSLRDQGDLPGASRVLEEAVGILEGAVDERSSSSRAGEAIASSDLRELSVQLADCYGSLGGIFRRWGRLRDALTNYEKGAELERSEQLRMDNTYNQVNLLVTTILSDPNWLDTREGKDMIQSVLSAIERQISTSRREDPWAYSDAALLRALQGDVSGASLLWSVMQRLTPLPSVYRSGLPALKELQKKFPSNKAIATAVQQFEALSASAA